jgi:hypothetical protein
MTSQNEFSKNTLTNLTLSKSNSKKLESEHNNHVNLEKKLNIYGNFYDNYNDKLNKNVEILSNTRKGVNEDYYKNKNIHQHIDAKLSSKKIHLIISLVILFILIISTIFVSKKVFS